MKLVRDMGSALSAPRTQADNGRPWHKRGQIADADRTDNSRFSAAALGSTAGASIWGLIRESARTGRPYGLAGEQENGDLIQAAVEENMVEAAAKKGEALGRQPSLANFSRLSGICR